MTNARITLHSKLECRPMPNVMAAQPNTNGDVCITPQSLAGGGCSSAVQYNAPNRTAQDLDVKWILHVARFRYGAIEPPKCI